MAMEYAALALALTVYHEAGGDGHRGMQAVADTVINRVHDPKFPNTVEGVILQPGQYHWPRKYRHKTVEDLQRTKNHMVLRKEPHREPKIWNEALSIAQNSLAPGYKPTYSFKYFNSVGIRYHGHRGTKINHLYFG